MHIPYIGTHDATVPNLLREDLEGRKGLDASNELKMREYATPPSPTVDIFFSEPYLLFFWFDSVLLAPTALLLGHLYQHQPQTPQRPGPIRGTYRSRSQLSRAVRSGEASAVDRIGLALGP